MSHVDYHNYKLPFTPFPCVLQLESKGKEIASEKHLKALADREMGRLSKDIGKLVGERQELRDKVRMGSVPVFVPDQNPVAQPEVAASPEPWTSCVVT